MPVEALIAAVAPTAERRFPLRALGVAAAWGVGPVQILLGLGSCTFARLTHHPCPGCGMTRAVLAVLHGHVAAGIALHPLALPFVVVVGALAVETTWVTYRFGDPVRLWRLPWGRASLLAFVGIQAGMLLLWAVRFLGLFGGPVPV